MQKGRRMTNSSSKFKLATLVALFVALCGLSGCQTVKGAGKDIEKAGEGIQNSADRHS